MSSDAVNRNRFWFVHIFRSFIKNRELSQSQSLEINVININLMQHAIQTSDIKYPRII